MMKKMTHLLAGLCLGLMLLPLAPDTRATAATVTADYTDAAAEEKARNYFTDTEVIDQNGKKTAFLQRRAQGPRRADQLHFHQL